MIKVFNADETIFNNNGDKILNPLKAVILKEDNGDYELELETKIEDKDFIVNDKIIVCDTPWGEQGFRVYNPQKKASKITCTCKHLFYDTSEYLIKDANIVENNCNNALDHLNISCDVTTPFTTTSNITTINSFRCVRKSLEEAISTVLEKWGGHLVRDNFNISIMEDVGQDNGITLRYGKNISDFTCKEDWSKVVTKLLPVGKDGLLLDEEFITTNDLDTNCRNYGITYSKPYTKAISFSQDLDEEDYRVDGTLDEDAYTNALKQDLRSQAINYINLNCLPQVNYTVKANIDKITDVGDTIEVFYNELGISLTTRVLSVKWDCLQEKYVEVNFGNFANKLKNLMTDVTKTTTTSIQQEVQTNVMPTVDLKLADAYDKIWNALDGSYCIYNGDQILIVDRLPKEEAINCLRINSQGIAFSQNGINGTFTSAWTIDGTFNAQNINVINLIADIIKGGTLKLGSETQQHGQLEIYDEANNLIGQMNTDGLTMYANDGSYIKINNEVGFAGFDKNDNKIYWVDGETFCTKKFIAQNEITVGGKLRLLPIENGSNTGIGFVAIVE